MKIRCPGCGKIYNIPDERLPFGKKIAFPCPSCRHLIDIDLRPDSERLSQESENSVSDADLPRGEALKKLILKRLKELPPMPQVMFKAREVMSDNKSNFKALADILETDQAMATRVLRLSNSAYYGLAGKVSSVQHAAVLLGYQTVGEIVSMAGSSSLLGESLKGYKLDSGDLWQHSLAVAISSRIIARMVSPDYENDAFASGLIHDAGKLVLDKYLLERNDVFTRFLSEGDKTFLEAEKQILGFDHAEIASEMCRTWKIPDALVRAIHYHHHPSRSSYNILASIIHVADSLSLMSGLGTGMDGMLYEMDSKAIDVLGLRTDSIEGIIQETVESVQKIIKSMQ